jgi:hypothetical protein
MSDVKIPYIRRLRFSENDKWKKQASPARHKPGTP